MKPQDIQMTIKLARKLIGYSGLTEFPGVEDVNYKTTYLAPKLGVVSDDNKIEIWLRRDPTTPASDATRVFYALNLDGENYMVMIYRPGRWIKYLHQILQEKEKRGYAAIDDSDLFPEIPNIEITHNVPPTSSEQS